MADFPVRIEREVRAEAPEQVYRAVAQVLQNGGFVIRETHPPAAGQDSSFQGGFRAVRDTVLDEEKRRQGRIMLATAAALTVVMLLVYVLELTTNRFLASAPLLPIVLLGGWGLSRLREPAQRVRRVIETWFEPSAQSGGLHLVVQAGVGHAVGDDAVGDWLDETQQPELDTRPLDEILERFKAA